MERPPRGVAFLCKKNLLTLVGVFTLSKYASDECGGTENGYTKKLIEEEEDQAILEALYTLLKRTSRDA